MVDFVQCGGSKAEAARRFKVGEASVYRWLKPGGLTYHRPGPQQPHKLDGEELRRQVEQQADMTQGERARHFGVSRHGLWNALHKRHVTRNKNDAVQRAQPAATKKVSAPS